MRLPACLLALCALASSARAGDLVVSVTTPAGKPVPNAVVMVRPLGGPSRGPIRFPWPYVMTQRDMQFDPFVLIVPVGAEVRFPNADPFRHHVYSFSPAKPFELKLYSRDETRSVRFDKAGVVVLGCNIHDNMSAYIRIVDTPYAAKSSAVGVAEIHDIPAGPATVTIWHPLMRDRKGEQTRDITESAAGVVRLSVSTELRATPLRRGGY